MCRASFFQQVIPNVSGRLDLAGLPLFHFTCLQPASCPRQRPISLIIQLKFCQHFFFIYQHFCDAPRSLFCNLRTSGKN
jgi:hypothetical protein